MTDQNEKSRVLTLVFTDLADSTALKTARGDDAVDTLITRHREHVVRLAETCAGRVIDWAGDGCFLTFDTSSAAVMFALQLQQAHADDSDLPGVRIGVHLGEVTERPGPDGSVQVKGLAVDVAARVQALAKPGQVLMSSSVYNSARRRMGVDKMGQPILWQLHGLYDLKGMDHPLEIGEAGLEGLSPLEAPEAGEKARPSAGHSTASSNQRDLGARSPVRSWLLPTGIVAVIVAALAYVSISDVSTPTNEPVAPSIPDSMDILSLAVLPLTSLSDDPQQEYLAAGITDSITSELAKIKALKIISNSSAMRYKKGETELSMPEIADELGVDGLIEGSMLREGDDVRITVQLIHGPSDSHVWSESYTYTVTSIMKLQSDVALAIADAVGAELTGDYDEAIALYAQAVASNSNEGFLGYLGMAYGMAGRGDDARAILEDLDATALSEAVKTYARALVHFGLGDIDETLTLLEESASERHRGISEMNGARIWEPLRDNPRFRAILEKFNLPDAEV